MIFYNSTQKINCSFKLFFQSIQQFSTLYFSYHQSIELFSTFLQPIYIFLFPHINLSSKPLTTCSVMKFGKFLNDPKFTKKNFFSRFSISNISLLDKKGKNYQGKQKPFPFCYISNPYLVETLNKISLNKSNP